MVGDKMNTGRTILVAALTSLAVTGLTLKLAQPYLLKQVERRVLLSSALVLTEALNAMAQGIAQGGVGEVEVAKPAVTTTTTWPVLNAALRYAN